VLLNLSCVSVLFQTEHQIDRPQQGYASAKSNSLYEVSRERNFIPQKNELPAVSRTRKRIAVAVGSREEGEQHAAAVVPAPPRAVVAVPAGAPPDRGSDRGGSRGAPARGGSRGAPARGPN
jgi:hypothetical protein